MEKVDFTYIDDLVDGIILVITHPEARNQIFNMTYGGSRSIQDLVRIIQRQFPQAQVEYVERDKLMPFRGTLSVNKAKQLLGYAPQHPIEAGFPKYIDWYRSLTSKSRLAA
jgi:nucleoside-diphosphate-sugar epimerase